MDESDEIDLPCLPEEHVDCDAQTVLEVGDIVKIDSEKYSVRKFAVLETDDGVIRFPVLDIL